MTQILANLAPPGKSAPAIPTLPPVSAALETELRRVIKESGLVLWLDTDANYQSFAQSLAERSQSGAFPFPVLRFSGSYLELMLQLEAYGNGLTPEKVLVYLPGLNKTSIGDTPLYELYKAGRMFERALDTLIEEASLGHVRPEEAAAFRKRKPSLEEADVWLSAVQASETNSFLIGLEHREPASVLSELFTNDSTLARDLLVADNAEQFVEYLQRRLGLARDTWLTLLHLESGPLKTAELRTLFATWLMAVEFTTDLREAPRRTELAGIPALPKSVIKLCHELVEQLRLRWADTYQQLSGEFEGSLGQDAEHDADKLGSIDTFRFEERAIRKAAIQALVTARFDTALNYARERSPAQCFWARHDKLLERTWRLVESAAALGRLLEQSGKGLKTCGSLDEATLRYRDTLFKVDQAHRQFEQLFHHQHSTELEDDIALAEGRRTLQRAYRTWADALTADFCKLCEQLGPLPSASFRQRAIYEQFVQPLIEGGQRVAVFMVDAMRFEMAEELRRYFETKKYKTTLDARLAELPTITPIGMNALAPVSQQGRLRLVFNGRKIDGFRSGDAFTVSRPEHRIKAMQSRSLKGDAIDWKLADVIDANPPALKEELRRKPAANLVVVRSLELDSAGEKGFHLGTFEQTLVQLREAVQRLQNAGISHFVLVADHGFLLQDQTAEQITYKDEPSRRHVLSPTTSGMTDALEIPLSALDYDTDAEGYLVFRRDTAVWRTKEVLEPFVHGGNSLQERVVPVLCLDKQTKAGVSAARYEVVASALEPEGIKRQRLSLQVQLQRRSSGELSFAGPRKISLALRVLGHDALPEIVEVTPPGTLDSGMIHVPPGVEAAIVTFGLEGEIDEKVRVEVYHPDAAEQVEPAIVSGWFAMHRNRRVGKPGGSGEHAAAGSGLASTSPAAPDTKTAAPTRPSRASSPPVTNWHSDFDDPAYAKAFERIEQQQTVNEIELAELLGSTRQVRFFARRFDELKKRVPFEVEIQVVNSLKTYVKGGNR